MNRQTPTARRSLARSVATCLVALALAVTSMAGPAAAASSQLPASKAFDLSAPVAKKPLAGLLLKRMTYPKQGPMQSFAFDNVHHYVFVVQNCCYGKDNVFKSGPELTIDRIPLTGHDAGKVIDTMTVPNAGHGGSIGVVPASAGRSQIWLEGGAVESSYKAGGKTHHGYFGTRIDSFIYTPNRPEPPKKLKLPKMTKHFTGYSHITASTDPVHHRIAFRYQAPLCSGEHCPAKAKDTIVDHLMVFDWNDVAAHKELLSAILPTIPGTAQGFALYGQYFYVLTGDTTSNTAFVSVDLDRRNSAGVAAAAKPVPTAAFRSTLAGHKAEPEGLATFEGSDKRIGLFFGFSAHQSTSGPVVTTVTIGCKVGFLPHVQRSQPETCPS